jgi:hypothetical protein
MIMLGHFMDKTGDALESTKNTSLPTGLNHGQP